MRRLSGKMIVVMIGLLLAGMMAFAGGGQSGKAQNQGTASKIYQRDPNLNLPGTFPINKQKVSLRIGIEQNAMVENWETNWMTRQIEEKGNYDLSFEIYPAGEMNQKLELMVMAGGIDLPDVLLGTFDLASITKYGQAGMVIPLNAYYTNSAYYINEALKDVSFDPLKYVTSYDGNIYGMFRILSYLNTQYSQGRINIYEPWLKKLGLSMPQTIDEFLNVLRAFRDKDPNGNGEKDEIPLVSYRDMMKSDYFIGLMMPFIYSQPNFWMINDGKIDVAFNKPAWREGIRYAKRLIDEGLLSPLSFTQDQTQMTGIINPMPYKVGAFIRFSASNLGANDVRRTEYAIVPPLRGPEGRQWLWWPNLPSIRMLITKNCKTPESAFMLGDLLAVEELSLGSHLGEKGVDWKEPPANIKIHVEGYKPVGVPILPWGTLQNKHWAENGPFIIGNKNGLLTAVIDDPTEYMIPILNVLPDEIKYGTKDPITGIIYNEEEQEVINDLHSTIITYVQESFARFSMGDLNIDTDWDNYLAEFEKMGLESIISVTQSAYNRMNK